MSAQNEFDKIKCFKSIRKGVAILKSNKRYKQVTIINKLRFLGFELSEASLSNILNDKQVGDDILFETSRGIQKIIKLELGLLWEGERYNKNLNLQDWEPTIVSSLSTKSPSVVSKPGFAFHEEGRLSIRDKVDFISTAQHEVIEFGVTLNTFTSYFISRRDLEFKLPVEKLLKNGINFKCFLLNPECNEARLYIEDRKRVMKHATKDMEKIKLSIEKLKNLQLEFNHKGYKGSFEIYTYKHIPYNYFMVVDGSTPNAKMMISHYIYGEQRAKCPVIEFSKNQNLSLFKRYWTSLNLFTKEAKQLFPEK